MALGRSLQPLTPNTFGSFQVLVPHITHAFDQIHLNYSVSIAMCVHCSDLMLCMQGFCPLQLSRGNLVLADRSIGMWMSGCGIAVLLMTTARQVYSSKARTFTGSAALKRRKSLCDRLISMPGGYDMGHLLNHVLIQGAKQTSPGGSIDTLSCLTCSI